LPGPSAVSEGKMVTNKTLKVSDSEEIAQKRVARQTKARSRTK
jgi:hypothetical protein